VAARHGEDSPVDPMLLARASSIPSLTGSGELKFDGFRAIVTVESGRVRSMTGRGGGKLAGRFPALAGTLGDAVDADRVTLDGEIIAGTGDVASFELLLRGAGRRRSPIPVSFVAFDLLALDGRVLTQKPIEHRRGLLAQVVRDTDAVARIRSYEDPAALFAAAEHLRMEGVVVKASRSLYYPGLRCGQRCWVKVKTSHARTGEPRWN